jgi:hypothetical protein
VEGAADAVLVPGEDGYDPANTFRINHNIPPASGDGTRRG